jgi:hypothetical protein
LKKIKVNKINKIRDNFNGFFSFFLARPTRGRFSTHKLCV